MGWYQIPPDTNEAEKIVGGILTLVQVAWLAGGLVLAAGVMVLLKLTVGGNLWLLGFIFAPLGIPFVVIKIKGMPLATYLKRRLRYKRQPKYFINQMSISGTLAFHEKGGPEQL